MSYLSISFCFLFFSQYDIGTICISHSICAVLCKVQLTRANRIRRTCHKPLTYALAKKKGDAQLVDDLNPSDSQSGDVMVGDSDSESGVSVGDDGGVGVW